MSGRAASATSDLAKVQSAVAALVLEPGRIGEFRRGPAAYARRFGLRGKGAALLAGLDIEGAAYFASRRAIDRFHYLKADLPRSVAAVEAAAGLAASYFADCPYAKEDPREEVRQVRAWARKAAKAGRLHPAIRDLVEVEAAGFLLLDEAYAKPKRSPTLRRAPGVELLVLRHDPDEILSDPLSATPGRFPVALHREPDDVEPYRLEPVAEALLKAATGRKEESVVRSLAPKFGQKVVKASLGDLRKLGLLVPR